MNEIIVTYRIKSDHANVKSAIDFLEFHVPGAEDIIDIKINEKINL